MGRKITLFRFDVEPGSAAGSLEEEHVTVERPEEFADDGDEDEGGSLGRTLLAAVGLLAVGAVGGFLLRGKVAGRELARAAKSKLPIVGDDGEEPDRAERGAATLVGFGFLVALTTLSKRLYGTGPLDDAPVE